MKLERLTTIPKEELPKQDFEDFDKESKESTPTPPIMEKGTEEVDLPKAFQEVTGPVRTAHEDFSRGRKEYPLLRDIITPNSDAPSGVYGGYFSMDSFARRVLNNFKPHIGSFLLFVLTYFFADPLFGFFLGIGSGSVNVFEIAFRPYKGSSYKHFLNSLKAVVHVERNTSRRDSAFYVSNWTRNIPMAATYLLITGVLGGIVLGVKSASKALFKRGKKQG